MNRHLLSSAAVVFAFSMFALPTGAAAQGRRNGNGQSRGTAVTRSDGGRRGGNEGQGRANQGQARGNEGQARGNQGQARVYQGQSRGQAQTQRRDAPRVEGRAVPRSAPRIITPRNSGRYGNYRPSYRGSYAFSRPYYTFRPRVRVGFNLWVGYPVVFPYYDPYYYDPYGYDPYAYDPYDYPAPPPPPAAYPGNTYPPQQGSVNVTPNATGGLSFEITPADAAVYVDGNYAGTASQFSPSQAPLSLTPGRHHIEIRAQGFDTISFDTDVLAGQVIPYQGDMSRR
jgi:PEGA domain